MKTCAICSSTLTGRQQRYCSPLCASRGFNEARKSDGRLREYRRKNAERIRLYNLEYSAKWRATEEGKAAIQNGMARRRARLAGVDTEKFDKREIFDRDGWVCRLCDESVNQALVYPNPLSASLDHIVPITLGGGHTRANTQLAHLVCNIRKGNRAA